MKYSHLAVQRLSFFITGFVAVHSGPFTSGATTSGAAFFSDSFSLAGITLYLTLFIFVPARRAWI